MARFKVDKDIRRKILDARRMIQEAEKLDCNEAETRRRIERIFETVMEYDTFKYLSRERAVRGAGETEHVDFTIQVDEGEDAKPIIMLEIKRVNVALGKKHLNQVSSYAINAGCEWVLLTNSKEWRLYHISFGQPPVTKLIRSWNIVDDDIPALAKNFALVSFKSVKKGTLDKLWQKTNVLHPRNLLQAILSESSVKLLRRELKKESGVHISPEDIVSAVRRMLNEVALSELENVQLLLPEKKPKRKKRRITQATNENTSSESSDSEEVLETGEEQIDSKTTDLEEDK